MKVEKQIRTIASTIVLTKEEVNTLVSAQKILNNIWDELARADAIDDGIALRKIYNSVNDVGFALDEIANLVNIED